MLLLAIAVPANASTLGPTPYLSFSDSPFSGGGFDWFYLEDFEDGLLNTPGVTGDGAVTSTTPPPNPSIIDSVDADDGVIDGSGLNGDSYFRSFSVTFTFDAIALGQLPTHAGLVWTDGEGTITFQAFDASNVLLGTVIGTHAQSGVYTGETAEDRFYGAINPGGISRIVISNAAGIEVDHLQYGHVVPLPAALPLLASGLGGLGLMGWWRRRRHRT
jgi:hypothetical protein